MSRKASAVGKPSRAGAPTFRHVRKNRIDATTSAPPYHNSRQPCSDPGCAAHRPVVRKFAQARSSVRPRAVTGIQWANFQDAPCVRGVRGACTSSAIMHMVDRSWLTIMAPCVHARSPASFGLQCRASCAAPDSPAHGPGLRLQRSLVVPPPDAATSTSRRCRPATPCCGRRRFSRASTCTAKGRPDCSIRCTSCSIARFHSGSRFNLELVASYPAAFAGMYWFLRRLQFSRAAALFGAMLFAFGGYNLLHYITSTWWRSSPTCPGCWPRPTC